MAFSQPKLTSSKCYFITPMYYEQESVCISIKYDFECNLGPVHTETLREPAHYLKQYKNAGKHFRVYGALEKHA